MQSDFGQNVVPWYMSILGKPFCIIYLIKMNRCRCWNCVIQSLNVYLGDILINAFTIVMFETVNYWR
jgi:lipid-A-disaccharide synthase-like uncharacterized protein